MEEPSELRQTEIIKIFYESRRFEAELYWKRSTYFWTLLGVIFTAYGIITGVIEKQLADHNLANISGPSLKVAGSFSTRELTLLRYILVCAGLVCSIGWYLVNRGSKFTNEKWTQIIEEINKSDSLLERLRLIQPPKECFKFQNLLRGFPYSSSKINHLINLFIIFVWTLLYIVSSCALFQTPLNLESPIVAFVLLGFTMFIIISMFTWGRRSKESQNKA